MDVGPVRVGAGAVEVGPVLVGPADVCRVLVGPVDVVRVLVGPVAEGPLDVGCWGGIQGLVGTVRRMTDPLEVTCPGRVRGESGEPPTTLGPGAPMTGGSATEPGATGEPAPGEPAAEPAPGPGPEPVPVPGEPASDEPPVAQIGRADV